MPAVAGVIAAAVMLGLNISWGTPGIAETSPLVAMRGNVDFRLGLAAPSASWSLSADSGRAASISADECPQPRFLDAAGALPSPCAAGAPAPGQSLLASFSRHGSALAAALDALDRGNLAAARADARNIDVVAEHLVSWMAATSASGRLDSSEIARTIATLGDWPSQSLLRARYEQALAREQPSGAIVLATFTRVPPSTAAGVALFAKALVAAGRNPEAEELVRRYWREQLAPGDSEQPLLSAFGGTLTPADHQARVARLMYQGKIADAERASRLLDKGPRDLVAAWIAVARQRAGAVQLLDQLAPEQRQDPSYTFARIQALYQAGSIDDAAALMQSAPTDPKLLIDPDAWSQERRVLARAIADKDPRMALALTSANLGASADEKVESEIDAGWYALRQLGDAAEAEPHLQLAASLAATASGKVRAEYWLGRACEALGRSAGAAEHYRVAGRYPTSFYGQLALARLGIGQLPIAPPPTIDAETERRFLSRELVQAAGRLAAIGRPADAKIFYQYLAETLTDPGEIALLATLAQGRDDYPSALRLGKVANLRQAGVDAVAFPVAAVPALDRADVELSAVYAVARQESEFQIHAVSPVGAQGLLQLMPATAREVAGRLGLPYSMERLGTDPTYNATLGAAFLGSLLAQFNGSYAMSFAAYNAGAGRVQEWAKTYGDPRGSDAEVVDWIERIPFDETRNYVKRTLENLQVYRARLGSPALRLEADLTGSPGERLDPLAAVARKQVLAELPRAVELAGQSGGDSRSGSDAALHSGHRLANRVAVADKPPAVKVVALASDKPGPTPVARPAAKATLANKATPAATTSSAGKAQAAAKVKTAGKAKSAGKAGSASANRAAAKAAPSRASHKLRGK